MDEDDGQRVEEISRAISKIILSVWLLELLSSRDMKYELLSKRKNVMFIGCLTSGIILMTHESSLTSTIPNSLMSATILNGIKSSHLMSYA